MELAQRFWEIYGFCGNPYETLALSTNLKSVLPIAQAFVGRDLESLPSRQITITLSNPGGGRLVIEGEIGVGKTTFVNYHRYMWEYHARDRLFTPIHEIPIYPEWGVRDVLTNLLSALTNKFLLLFGEKKTQANPVFGPLLALNRLFPEKSFQWEANIFGIGGGYGQGQHMTTPEISYTTLFHYYEDAVAEIRKSGYAGIVIHFDNLEFMGRSDPHKTQHLLEEIRDILQIQHVYHLFVGYPGFFGEIIAPLDRVRSIFGGWPVYLPPLSKEEVIQALYRRYEILSGHKKYIPPTDESSIAYLYDVYQGKIRFIMDALDDIVRHFTRSVARTISLDEMRQMLRHLAEERMRQILTDREWKILIHAASFSAFSSPQLVQQLKIPKQNMALYLDTLLRHNLIYRAGQTGKTFLYKVREDVKLVAGLPNDPAPTAPIWPPLSERQILLLETLKRFGQATALQLSTETGLAIHTTRREMKTLCHWCQAQSHGHTRGQYYTDATGQTGGEPSILAL